MIAVPRGEKVEGLAAIDRAKRAGVKNVNRVG